MLISGTTFAFFVFLFHWTFRRRYPSNSSDAIQGFLISHLRVRGRGGVDLSLALRHGLGMLIAKFLVNKRDELRSASSMPANPKSITPRGLQFPNAARRWPKMERTTASKVSDFAAKMTHGVPAGGG